MMLAFSELREHEDYCGSRTEPCVACGRYVMVRDAEIHRETNCQYPAVDQKNESESSAADAATGFDWIGGERDFRGHFGALFGAGMFGMRNNLPEHIREMLESRQGDLSDLENVFGGMRFCGTSSRVPRPEDAFFGHRLRPFVDDPPPYIDHSNADDTHADDSRVTPEIQGTFTDHISVDSDDDDDGMCPVLH